MRGESKGEVDGGEYGFNRFYDKGITPLTNHYYIFVRRGTKGDVFRLIKILHFVNTSKIISLKREVAGWLTSYSYFLSSLSPPHPFT